MSDRLAGALVDAVAARAKALPEDSLAFFVIPGVTVQVALAMSRVWDGRVNSLTLRVAAPEDSQLGEYLLGDDATATGARNQGGACIVVCEGQRVPDMQGIKGHESIEPADLLGTEADFNLLLRQSPRVDPAAVAAVWTALSDLQPAQRPPALRVATFIDQVAGGATVGTALPQLGAFIDDADPLHSGQIYENLVLATALEDADLRRPSSLAAIRARASQHLGNQAESILGLLRSGSDDLLERLTYANARKLLVEPPPRELAEQVLSDLTRFGASAPDDWPDRANAHLDASPRLKEDDDTRRQAAQELLDFSEEVEGPDPHHVLPPLFDTKTKSKLRALLRERKFSMRPLEESLILAVRDLPGVTRVELRKPSLPDELGGGSGHGRDILAVAALRMRAAPVFNALEAHGVELFGELRADLSERVAETLQTMGDPAAGSASTVELAVHGSRRGELIEIVWTPSAEDVGLVAVNSRFVSAPTSLYLNAAGTPGIGALGWQSLSPSVIGDDAGSHVVAAAKRVGATGLRKRQLSS